MNTPKVSAGEIPDRVIEDPACPAVDLVGEPSVLDNNTHSKSAEQILSLYDADEFRASDHGAVGVGLHLGVSETRVFLPLVMR